MSLRIKNNGKVLRSGKKRFFLPADVESECPKCGKVVSHEPHVSYPPLNCEFELLFCHEDEVRTPGHPASCVCEACYVCHEWSETVVIECKVKAVGR